MRVRDVKWLVPCLLLVAAMAWLFWHQIGRRDASVTLARRTVTASFHSSSGAPELLAGAAAATNGASLTGTNRLAWRLSNTDKSIGQLVNDRHALLLDNALIETANPLTLNIPIHLKAAGDPGAYIVQAKGPIDGAFRTMLARAGGQIISYIPNNAYLVRISAGGAAGLATQPLTQAVVPYEPYYKIQSSLLGLAAQNKPLPAGQPLNVGLFGDNAAQTIAAIEKLGGVVLAQDNSPFGPVVHVWPPWNWTALAGLPGVQIVEPMTARQAANDLSRATLGVAADTQVQSNYLFLTGSNVVVAVNDSGVDAKHPDFMVNGAPPLRIIGDSALAMVDTNGHGTHVAGIIAGYGFESTTVTNAQGSIMPATNQQFRGMAPLASLYSVAAFDFAMNKFVPDRTLQQAAAQTNALIDNNSWTYGNAAYDLAAANWDAAVRDALPQVTGSQPILPVFAAGNGGGGNNDGDGGFADTIRSPGTAKNVITVGALEQLRNITNIVTDLKSNQSAVWQPMTDSGTQVAGYSSRGNVGIQTEGQFGRYKPDVAAPGTFVISTRSAQWAQNAYYNPTNDHVTTISDILKPHTWTDPQLQFFVFQNANEVTITAAEPVGSPFVSLPIYVWPNVPPPVLVGTNSVDINGVSTPLALTATSPVNAIWQCAASNTTSANLPYTLSVDVRTTNDLGNYYMVLSNLNDSLDGFSPPHYYRYETGTSMSAADVSGVLALMQDYFTNQLQLIPSPALLKAMLINGARPTGAYNFQVQNNINYEGWGLVSLPDSLPPGLTNQLNAPCDDFFVDQSPTNALATGDSHTYYVTLDTNTDGAFLPLQVTVAWTDPPGDPAAAIKLVNNLDLVVSNMDTGDTYFGNDIPAGSTFNNVWPSNTLAGATSAADSINNVEQVLIPPLLATHYAVTVIGKEVNVNAVNAQTNNAAGLYAPNVVQDYALVIACGEGEVSNAFSVVDGGIVSNPTNDQDLTFVMTTNTPMFNQMVGANSPVLNTNTVPFITNAPYGGSGQDTLGLANQWHFYVVTNNALDSAGINSDVTNAAFVTFLPANLSVSRMGVYEADNQLTNANRLEAGIDLYVSTDPNLLALDPVVIANCANGAPINASSPPGVNGVFNGSALGRGGTKFIVDSNSTPGQVYYVGVKAEDQMASEYAFVALFTSTPFSRMENGNQIVTGLPVPNNIPDGSPAHPGTAYTFGIALHPITIENLVVTNFVLHQNYGDLVGMLTHNNQPVVLNNHDEPVPPPAPPGPYNYIYDETTNTINSMRSDGPGNLTDYQGGQGAGLWILTQTDSALTQTGSVQNFSMQIQPHIPLTAGVTNKIPPHSWAYDFVDVPAGATNLTINATNVTLPPDTVNPPLMVIKFGQQPTLTDADKGPVALINGSPPGNSLSIGPTDVPPIRPGRYWVGITNQSDLEQDVSVIAVILPVNPGGAVPINSTVTGTTGILDDAVTYSDIFVTNTLPIASLNVGIMVQSPRISDLVFHLISPSPDSTRVLLMENRGGDDTNGAGATVAVTNTTVTWFNGFEGGTSDTTPSAGQYFAEGWLVNAGSVDWLNSGPPFNTPPYEGNWYIDLDGSAAGEISTNITTVPGMTYTLSFAYTKNPFAGATPNPQAQILINGSPLGTVAPNFVNSAANPNWQTTSFVFTATSPSTALTFNSLDPASSLGGVYLDAVSLATNQVVTNFLYLTFTENTNLTTTPIKFAPPPFVPNTKTTTLFTNGFEGLVAADYITGQTVAGWTVLTNQVSVITDPINAYEGSNYLALASGTIVTNLPTVAGNTYTLTFAYRGPGIVSMWRGESNANDSVDGNNGTAIGGIAYTNGEVGETFSLNGTSSYVSIPDSPSLDIFTNRITVECWIKNNQLGANPVWDWIVTKGNSSWRLMGTQGANTITFYGSGLANGSVMSSTRNVNDGQWHHVAGVYDGNNISLYVDGTLDVAQPNSGLILQDSDPVQIGQNTGAPGGSIFNGLIDEVSLYKRALSPSEIKAIYQKGSAGKFDAGASFPQNLAEAQVSLNGQVQANLSGNNTDWQIETITFTATQNGTPFQISGVEPGMLLDAFTLTQVPGNLYYLPEQPLDAFIGKGAYGDWLLEIQDDRAGAGLTNLLVSWQLQFVFANTNAVASVVQGGIGFSNQFLPGGDIAWYQINVPANANYATNILLFASAPVNVWFSTNTPPAITNLSDVDLIPNSTGNTGSPAILTTNSSPLLVPGGTYYLGVQNLNSATVNYGIEVDFDHGNAAPAITSVSVSGGKITMQWTAPAGAQFEVQWTDDLAQPWQTDSNVITSDNGNFSFTDDGTQTEPLGAMRFYRLVQISP